MSERLTNKWTGTLDEAFGASGTKGRLGEEFMAKVFESWGWEYKRNESDYKSQIEGKDIEFKKPEWAKFYTGDVKNNMDIYGNFYVHKDWLFNVKCDRIFHVNPETGWIAWYGVQEMRDAYDEALPFMKFTTKTRPSFVKVTRYNGDKNA
jgi:hypothetical protein